LKTVCAEASGAASNEEKIMHADFDTVESLGLLFVAYR